jgi:hypothetical protein
MHHRQPPQRAGHLDHVDDAPGVEPRKGDAGDGVVRQLLIQRRAEAEARRGEELRAFARRSRDTRGILLAQRAEQDALGDEGDRNGRWVRARGAHQSVPVEAVVRTGLPVRMSRYSFRDSSIVAPVAVMR